MGKKKGSSEADIVLFGKDGKTVAVVEAKAPMPPERIGFGMRLKAAREAQSFSQDDIAQRFDINKSTVSAWETGRGDPGVFRLRELSKLYKTSSESLLYEDAPSSEAMQIAAAYDGLNERQQKTFHALWLAFLQDAMSDDGVEDASPAIKERAEAARRLLELKNSRGHEPLVHTGKREESKKDKTS